MNTEAIEGNGVKSIERNSEILYIYDARMCNPNGDPDDENKPRMDYNQSINLVSDVRLKRYIRDYLRDFKGKTIFVSKVEGNTVSSTNRLKNLIENNRKEIEVDKTLNDLFNKKNEPSEKNLENHQQWVLSKLIDVRFFGATMTLKSETREEGKGASITFTGPIQFNWGYSLNKVSGPMDSRTITSTFAGAKEDYSTMGKDYRVAYSLIAFHGIISAKRAEHTNLTEDDIDLFDDAMINAIPFEATTRSKIGQYPLFYIRVEYNTPEFFLGDLRRYVKIADRDSRVMAFEDTANIRSLDDYNLDLTKLYEKLIDCNDKILRVHLWKHEDLRIEGWDIKNGYIFSWDEIPGKDNKRLEEFLAQKFDIDWAKAAKIEKIDDGKTIKISIEKSSLSLRLNDERNEVILEINDGIAKKFSAKMENCELNIYEDGNTKNTKIPIVYLPKQRE
jgi:CRISPR-associated protein Csh2